MSKQKSNPLSSFLDMLKRSKKTILLMVIVAVVSITVTTLISMTLNATQSIYVPSLGVIKTIEVEAYSDANANNVIEQFEWGELTPGESAVNEFYIKSVSNVEIVLTLNMTDWSPPDISDYITLTCNYNGQKLSPGEIIPLTLTVETPDTEEFKNYLVENAVNQFSVDIHFIGVE